MHESEILKPVNVNSGYTAGYTMPELLVVTSSAMLYRVRKAGKFFIIKTPKDNSGQSLAMLQREYELSVGRQHPNVIGVFTFEPSTIVGPGIIMEYVEGRTLADFLAENPTMAMRHRVFEQLLAAVAYIHRSGIVHNDIKPGNILITRADNDVRLIDFGLADDDAHYLARTLGCTPAYASPELLAREKSIDARSDIYSLGVVMQEIFAGVYSRIAKRCLCADREKRYANADELLRAFKHRHRPAKIIGTLLVALLLLFPLLHFGLSKYAEERRIAEREAMMAKVERELVSIYQSTADSLLRTPYFEFAVNHIVAFYDAVGEYQKENIASITDPELNAQMLSAYMQKINACQDTLWQGANSLPSFYKSNLSPEAIIFYDSLITRRLPFIPYNK